MLPGSSKKKNNNTYRLKTMAMARVFSEVLALIVFLCLPFILLFANLMAELDLVVKAAVILGSVFSFLMLPAYGFITWQITVTETGIVGWSLIKRRQLNFNQLVKLNRKSNFNWQRYVLTYDSGDITFPLWFERLDDLIKSIRAHLPVDLSAQSDSPKIFRQDSISYFMLLVQVSFGVALTVVSVTFTSYLFMQDKASVWDCLLVLIFNLILGISMFFRAVTVALMPKKVVVSKEFFTLQNLFFEKKLSWNKIETLKASNPFLPEGYLLGTKEGTFLIGGGFEELDELVAEVTLKARSHSSTPE